MEKLGIPHIPYTILWTMTCHTVYVRIFVTKDMDLVSAWRIFSDP